MFLLVLSRCDYVVSASIELTYLLGNLLKNTAHYKCTNIMPVYTLVCILLK